MDQIIKIHQVRQARPDSHLHLVNFLLQLRTDPLRASDRRVQVPPLPPLASHRDRDQDGVDGHSSSSSEKSDASQGGNKESQGVGSSSGGSLSVRCCNVLVLVSNGSFGLVDSEKVSKERKCENQKGHNFDSFHSILIVKIPKSTIVASRNLFF